MELVGRFCVGVFSLILGAITVMYMWGWFIVPLGVVDITIVHAYGLIMFKKTLFLNVDLTDKTDEQKKQDMIVSIVAPIVLLIIGFVTKSFM